MSETAHAMYLCLRKKPRTRKDALAVLSRRGGTGSVYRCEVRFGSSWHWHVTGRQQRRNESH